MKPARRSRAVRWCCSAAWLLLVGCQWVPTLGHQRLAADLDAKRASVPDAWQGGVDWSQEQPTGWLTDFEGGSLRSVVEQALAGNPGLKAAAARVDQARAGVGTATAALLPTLDGNGTASRSQRPGDQRFPGLAQQANRFTTGLSAAWELDLWGRLADQRGAALADLAARQSDYHAARLSLAANAAQSAVTVTELRLLVALSQADVEARQTQLKLLESQLDRGIDTETAALDVSLGRADLARSKADVEERSRQLDGARRSLETVLGGYPEGKIRGLDQLPRLRGSVPAGLPAALLSRRPDVLAAEQRLRATLNRESAAKKAFLPSIRLTGDRGFTSQQLASLISTPSATWTMASQLTQPLFEGGRLLAGVKSARASYDEALNLYAETVLTAFREVETALAAERFWSAQEAELRRALEQARTAEKLASGQYERGLADVLTLLESRRRAFDAERALIAAQANLARNRLALHLALGGDWE